MMGDSAPERDPVRFVLDAQTDGQDLKGEKEDFFMFSSSCVDTKMGNDLQWWRGGRMFPVDCEFRYANS